jgi:regulatory protein
MGTGDVKDPHKVADRMRALCSRREYCRRDVMKKVLAALDGDVAKAEEIVSKLVEERYVDDSRYAAAFARDKSAIAGWGAAKIRYMLAARGIDREIVAEALEEIDVSRADLRLQKLMENKARSLKDDPQRRIKLLRFGVGRGYGYEEVSSLIDRIYDHE